MRQAVIIGAGPAGLTAAFELLERTDIGPLVLEMSDCVGGIARTVNYKGNRLDIGPHRFFSKSDRVMEWWSRMMPLQERLPAAEEAADPRESRRSETPAEGPGFSASDRVMFVLRRKTRIYFLRKFFDYPLRLNAVTLAKLGPIRTFRIALSYAWAAVFGPKHPSNLEEFFISRFGRELYLTFFKSYTEKVWGESCTQISADWGAQRIKGLSISRAVLHFLNTLLGRKSGHIGQKTTETSLIEEFLYPQYGPGQMWGIAAEEVTRRGGKVLTGQRVTKLHVDKDQITAVDAVDTKSGETTTYPADCVFSTMPVSELIQALDADVPQNVREVARGLMYRDLISVGLLLKSFGVPQRDGRGRRPLADHWIYIQEPDVKLGRLQVFNNWGPRMVANPSTTWLGLEYFCYKTDDLWKLPDSEMLELAKTELVRLGVIDAADVLDGTVLHMPNTYPAYFGTYGRFGEIRAFLDRFSNLFLVGRNGMHKYNNQDHSMLTAMTAVDNIVANRTDKSNIWNVNTEQEYHEEKAE